MGSCSDNGSAAATAERVISAAVIGEWVTPFFAEPLQNVAAMHWKWNSARTEDRKPQRGQEGRTKAHTTQEGTAAPRTSDKRGDWQRPATFTTEGPQYPGRAAWFKEQQRRQLFAIPAIQPFKDYTAFLRNELSPYWNKHPLQALDEGGGELL